MPAICKLIGMAGLFQQQGSWIFLPSRVAVSYSVNGKKWSKPVEVTCPVEKTEEVLVKDFTFPMEKVDARYVRVVARNVAVCPSWHPGAGSNAWLFVDEINVQ